MPIYLGSTEITPDMLNGVSEIYAGSDLVWSAGLPVGTVFNFSYTGSVQSVTLPRGRYKLQCWGAQGGTSYGSSSGAGSKGGYSVGELTLTEETTLYIFVGGKGSRGSSTSRVNGGWNGGGASVGYSSYSSGSTYGYSYPACGGGATDISTVTSSMSYSSGRTNRSSASLLARCIVAGGGAGGSYRYTTTTTTSTDEVYVTNSSSASTYQDANQVNYGYSTSTLVPGGTYIIRGTAPTGTTSVDYAGTYIKSSGSTAWHWMSVSFNSAFTLPTTYDYTRQAFVFNGATAIDGSFSIYEVTTTSSTSNSSGYSNKRQQGGGTSGKGQYPGTQSSAGSGGAFGLGASQTSTNYRYCGGGGGGGWYGGGTSKSDSSTSYVNYSGGGSGFVNTAANSSYRPSGYTGLQLDSGSTTAGNSSFESTSGGSETGHSGNGYARITVID